MKEAVPTAKNRLENLKGVKKVVVLSGTNVQIIAGIRSENIAEAIKKMI